MDELTEVGINGSSWTIRTGVPASADPGNEPVASVHVLVRSWSPGGAEIRISHDSTGRRSESEVLTFAIQELTAAQDLFP